MKADLDYLDRLADALFACDCAQCEARRKEDLSYDLQRKFGCKTMADHEARMRRHIN